VKNYDIENMYIINIYIYIIFMRERVNSCRGVASRSFSRFAFVPSRREGPQSIHIDYSCRFLTRHTSL